MKYWYQHRTADEDIGYHYDKDEGTASNQVGTIHYSNSTIHEKCGEQGAKGLVELAGHGMGVELWKLTACTLVTARKLWACWRFGVTFR